VEKKKKVLGKIKRGRVTSCGTKGKNLNANGRKRVLEVGEEGRAHYLKKPAQEGKKPGLFGALLKRDENEINNTAGRWLRL